MERPRGREVQGHCVTLTILWAESTKPVITDPVLIVMTWTLKNIAYPKLLYRHFLFLESFSASVEKSNSFSFLFFLLSVIVKVTNAHFLNLASIDIKEGEKSRNQLLANSFCFPFKKHLVNVYNMPHTILLEDSFPLYPLVLTSFPSCKSGKQHNPVQKHDVWHQTNMCPVPGADPPCVKSRKSFKLWVPYPYM